MSNVNKIAGKLVMIAENALGRFQNTHVASVGDAEANLLRWESYGGPNNKFPRAIVVDMGDGTAATLIATLRQP